jgi:hypothetical protein
MEIVEKIESTESITWQQNGNKKSDSPSDMDN